MAIYGVGTDIISTARIERSFERHGDKFAERILGEPELERYHQLKNKIAFLAKRFAAKEAISKALGTGMREGIDFKQLVVEKDELGKPIVELTDNAQEWAQRNNITIVHLSISDEKDHTIAFAIAESDF